MTPPPKAIAKQRTVRYALEGVAVLIIAALAAGALALHLTRPPITYAQERVSIGTTVQARVENVLESNESQDENGLYAVHQLLEIKVLSDGPYKGKTTMVEYTGLGPTPDAVRFEKGSRAVVMISEMPVDAGGETETVYQVADHVRLLPLGIIGGLFVLVTLGVGRWRGLRALVGLALSGAVIGVFILPQILAHRDPVLTTLVGTGLILTVTLYLIQGWNVAGHTALLGMLASLGVTALLAILWARLTFLTGFGSEETLFLQAVGVGVQMRGLLLAGIILGAAGVLDDVIIAQVVAVFEVSAADATLRFRDLYRSGMRIGVTHLASMVNTLVLAYASTALPLLILFYLYPEPWHLTINRELLAEEIIRTLVGSTGLMLAVPLTTAIAAWVAPLFASSDRSVSSS